MALEPWHRVIVGHLTVRIYKIVRIYEVCISHGTIIYFYYHIPQNSQSFVCAGEIACIPLPLRVKL